MRFRRLKLLPEPPGRSLMSVGGNVAPRGMTALDRIRLTGPFAELSPPAFRISVRWAANGVTARYPRRDPPPHLSQIKRPRFRAKPTRSLLDADRPKAITLTRNYCEREFPVGYTQGSRYMKARRFTLRALLFALLLSPSSLLALARPFGAPSCELPKARFRVSHSARKTRTAPPELLAALPSGQRPAPRMHRIRGKKVSVEREFVLDLFHSEESRYQFTFSTVERQ